MSKIKVLIIDDSALVRQMLSEMLGSAPDIEVVGVAQDPLAAREKIKKLNPDVLTLDVEMPKMDGVTFLSNLMRLRPMPVVMVSSLTEHGADITLEALVDLAHTLEEYTQEIIEKVRQASKARVRQLTPSTKNTKKSALSDTEFATRQYADVVLEKASGTRLFKTTDKIIAIGASTGGTEAIKQVLSGLPPDCPGIVIAQHIPVAFSLPFAKRVNAVSPMTVCQASDGQQILPGHAYIAPGDRHLMVVRDGARYICKLNDGPPVNRHKPSVDVLFRSVAQNVGPNAISVILTGMGDDGARGMQEMKEAGAPTIAQDKKSSVVWGMPRAAVKRGCVDAELPLDQIAEKVLSLVKA
jgi:two-component system chemotaxis response regulator CheB